MAPKMPRVWVTLTAERLELLQRGKIVLLTQNGMRIGVRPVLGCCLGMRLHLKKDAKLVKSFKVCPYCMKELSPSAEGSPVYVKKSCSLKGCKRVKDPATGKWSWVRPAGHDTAAG